jgi:hypothetical protein
MPDDFRFDTTAAHAATTVTVRLDLPDGHYLATDLLHGNTVAFDATGGSGHFDFDLARWDTTAFAITH